MQNDDTVRQRQNDDTVKGTAMVDNQHKKITGYRDLTEKEIAAMNAVKDLEARFNGMIDHLRSLGDSIDQRNVTLAATSGEDAFMRAVRAIAKPARTSTLFRLKKKRT